jgi:ribosome biogenesis GTPase / thiamine phosphate phosphatase
LPRKSPRSRTPGPSIEALPEEHDYTIPDDAVRAIVIRAHGLWYEVKVLEGPRQHDVLIAAMRGGLKRRRRRTDIVAVGDRVWVTELPDNEGTIHAVEPRTRALVRTARNTRDTEQVILANPDQALFVFSIADPEPHVRMLDRFIILAEMQEIPVGIVVNKADLDDPSSERSIDKTFGIYHGLYPVFIVSAVTGHGIDELRGFLRGKTTAVAGPSGVGKSSILNAIDPGQRREVGAISEATGKGQHTTVGSRLYEIEDDTFVADTPGMRALAMHAIPVEHLDNYFVEFRPFLGHCFYHDCTHLHEPGCAVKEAREYGKIGRERYESYVSLRSGDEFKE